MSTMSTNFEYPDYPLPTLDRLNASIPEDLDAKKIARDWFATFSNAAQSGDAQAVVDLILPDGFWRDMLALTWDFRTFAGLSIIKQFLIDRLALSKVRNLRLKDEYVGLQKPFPDLAWINIIFSFETDVGLCSGITRLVPTANGEWKAHVIYTNLDALSGFPEKVGPLRNHNPNHGLWEEQRRREVAFEDGDPTVLIVGGGQSGLEVAARLKYLDITSLVVERNPRIGDNWRNRYEALCLHDPVWYDHMPYIPFPSGWPVYTPALKLANWLEQYAESLELNVWTASSVTKITQDAGTKKWHVTITRGDGKERTMVVSHVVFATGLGSGSPNTPSYPGMENYKGQILHSSQHKKAKDHQGKRVVIIGACTSAHDIAADYYFNGVDVTMYQRGSTYIMSTYNGWKVLMEGIYSERAVPVDIADKLNASFPHFMSIGINQRSVQILKELDKDVLEGLQRVGFRTNDGINGTGFGMLAWSKAGGYYLDTGASQLIVDGKIKLKNDSKLVSFTESGLKFEDGSELPADVVVFATGLGDARDHVRRLCGDEVASKVRPIWGLNKEGELNGVWRDFGVPNLWYMIGNLALCRFHSTHLAMQIKAIEEGIMGQRYSADE